MLIAYNNDIEFRSRWYHIQTEDNGMKDGHITTTVFFSGQILDSKTTSYLDAIAGIASEEEQNKIIKDAMTAQHKYFYTKLYEGAYEDHVNAAHKSPTAQSPHKSSPILQAQPSASQLGMRASSQINAFHSESQAPGTSRVGKPDILRASQQLPVANKNLSALSINSPLGGQKLSSVHSQSHIHSMSVSPARQPGLRHPLPRTQSVDTYMKTRQKAAWRGVSWPADDLAINVLVLKLLTGEEV